MWTRLARITAPTFYPVTLAEAKSHLRVAFDDEDILINGLIASATAYFDGPAGIGVALCEQTWELRVDEFPCGPLEIPLGPVSSVTSVKYIDAAGVEQTWDAANWEADLLPPARLRPLQGGAWPVTKCVLSAVKVRFVTGAANAGLVPADLKAAILLVIGHLYANREAVAPAAIAELPMAVQSIVNRHWVGRVA